MVKTEEAAPVSLPPDVELAQTWLFEVLINMFSSKSPGRDFDVANNSENEKLGFVLIRGPSLLNHAIAGPCLLMLFGRVASLGE